MDYLNERRFKHKAALNDSGSDKERNKNAMV